MTPSKFIDNPFSGYRSSMDPHQFVGRVTEINEIRQRVLAEGAFASVAIVGEAHSGKTSLMKYVFSIDPNLQERKIVIVDVGSIAKFDDPIKFFTHITECAHKELSRYSEYDETNNLPRLTEPDFITRELFDFLRRVKEMGFRLVFLLDEFQEIQIVFGNSLKHYHIMHEMIDNHQYKVSCVATIRGSIEAIQKPTTDYYSILLGKFPTISLGLMNEVDIRSLIDQRLSQTSVHMSEKEIRILISQAGLHPYFVEMIGFHWFNEKKKTPTNNAMIQAVDKAKIEVFRDFDRFRKRLGSERFTRLLELTNGKPYEPWQAGEFVRLGHLIERIGPSSNRTVRPFSELYAEYLARFMEVQSDDTTGESSVKRILFLAANPSNTTKLKLSDEFREIQSKLRQSVERDKFELHHRSSVRPTDIIQDILELRPNIVHFSGHGSDTGELIFEDESGLSQPVTVFALTSLFELVSKHIECVLLNACYSNKQANSIAKYVKYVIGMRKEIQDIASIEFTIGFYQALGDGSSFEDAYRMGRARIALSGISGEFTPKLISNRHG